MEARRVLMVFVLPAALSVLFASAVFAGITDPDGISDASPLSSSDSMYIAGLNEQYAVSEAIEVVVTVEDPVFDCGDLYITVYSAETDETLVQEAFFDQCFGAAGGSLPLGSAFSTAIGVPGSFVMSAQMFSTGSETAIAERSFTVK